MKVVAINSSPNMRQGNTYLIVKPFVDGMEEAGAEVEVFFTKKLNVKPCLGCYSCWFQTPGECVQEDDMLMLLPKILKADIFVIATPLYFDGISGEMKILLERLIPRAFPFIELRDSHTRHPLRGGKKPGKLVLISVCGFWELENFNAMLTHIHAICRNSQWEFAGALLRPHGAALREMQKVGIQMDDIFKAAKEPGKELIDVGKISPQTLKKVSRELVSQKDFVKIFNRNFEKMIEISKKIK